MSDASTDVWLVVGLGNPGPSYAGHRHNIGYMVTDELARPRCYMNEVGGPVKALATFYKVAPAQVVAIHDELDIPFDTMRVKLGGGDNGHNGLKSMRSSFGTGDFHRVRVGIGRPPGRQEVADFVLSDYSSAERKVLPFVVDTAADAVKTLVADGLEKTQQRFNS